MSHMHDDHLAFLEWRANQNQLRSENKALTSKLFDIQVELDMYKDAYQFSWLGFPIIRFPDDIVAYQELVWDLNPQKIIEVGVARGGSVILSASILKLLGPSGHVLGVDIDIRKHNRDRIEAHPVADRISLIEGSSVEDSTLVEVKDWLQGSLADIIVLDSNHTHDHVLNELKAYSSLVRVGGYLVLPDTAIEFFPPGYYSDRDWDKGNNPLTALQEFLAEHQNFAIDTARSTKAAITETPSGYVKRIS